MHGNPLTQCRGFNLKGNGSRTDSHFRFNKASDGRCYVKAVAHLDHSACPTNYTLTTSQQEAFVSDLIIPPQTTC